MPDERIEAMVDERVEAEAAALARRPAGSSDLLSVIKEAVASKADVETMRELLAMRREERAEQAREAYAQALVEFRANCPTIKRTGSASVHSQRTGQTHGYTYAQLPQAVEQIAALMSQCGLAATWATPEQSPEWISVRCTVTHILGHSESTTLSGPPDLSGSKNKLQAVKSTWTYLRRVTLFSLLGLVDKDELDDDGAGGAPGAEPPKPQAQRDIEAGPAAMTAKQRFVEVCRAKADDPQMNLQLVKKVFETISDIVGSPDPQACLDLLLLPVVTVDAEGNVFQGEGQGDAESDGPTGPDWPDQDDGPTPAAYKCDKCQATFIQAKDGKCPACLSLKFTAL